jgi:Flp pilus assembly pilin Flp
MQIHKHEKSDGRALVSYALILVSVALAVILVLAITGTNTREIFCRMTGAIGGDMCEQQRCALAFDNPTELDAWNAQDARLGNLTVEDGQLCNKGNQINYFAACAAGGFEGEGYGNFTATLDGIQISNYENGRHPGFDLVFRADGQGNGYWFTYSGKANQIIFWKQINGYRVRLDSARVPAEWVDEELNFVLATEGDTFSAYRDDQLILETSDAAYDSGIFGWRNKPGSATCINGMEIE